MDMIYNQIREVFLRMSYSIPKIHMAMKLSIYGTLLDILLFTHEISEPSTLIPIFYDPKLSS